MQTMITVGFGDAVAFLSEKMREKGMIVFGSVFSMTKLFSINILKRKMSEFGPFQKFSILLIPGFSIKLVVSV